MLKKDEKVTSITLDLGPHFGLFWVIFANLVLLGNCFWDVFVFASFADSIFTVLGIIFECFFDAFFDGLTFEFAYENPINFFDESINEEYRGYYEQGDTILVKLSKLGRAEFDFFEKKYNQSIRLEILLLRQPIYLPISRVEHLAYGQVFLHGQIR